MSDSKHLTEEDRKLSGRPLSISDLNLAFYGKMDPDSPDFDTRKWVEAYKQAMPRVSTPIGKAIIFSTGGEIGGSNYFKELWDEKNRKSDQDD